jgi:hypothetical protein
MCRKLGLWIILFITVIAGSFLPLAPLQKAHAAPDTSAQAFINGQNYNQLVGDPDFIDINSMGVSDIQNFLVSQGSGLATISSSQLGTNNAGRTAAQIIYDVAHNNNSNDSSIQGCYNGICLDSSTGTVSPKVILITLQKEQSLITTGNPSQGALNSAMGYGCTDSGGDPFCGDGFTRQVEGGAWQLRYNYESSRLSYSSAAPYIVGDLLPNMTYNLPDQGLSGSVTVYLSNNATASLYNYTPHLFNGNYNFWKLGILWFGFSTSAASGGGANDTTALQAGTYTTLFTASGTKNSSDSATFNGQTIAGIGPTSWKVTFAPGIGTNSFTVYYNDSSGTAVASKTFTIVRRKIGDINGDGKVDVLDLSILFSHWNQTIQGDNWANLNNVNDWMSLNPDVDNTINILDLSLMFANWTG